MRAKIDGKPTSKLTARLTAIDTRSVPNSMTKMNANPTMRNISRPIARRATRRRFLFAPPMDPSSRGRTRISCRSPCTGPRTWLIRRRRTAPPRGPVATPGVTGEPESPLHRHRCARIRTSLQRQGGEREPLDRTDGGCTSLAMIYGRPHRSAPGHERRSNHRAGNHEVGRPDHHVPSSAVRGGDPSGIAAGAHAGWRNLHVSPRGPPLRGDAGGGAVPQPPIPPPPGPPGLRLPPRLDCPPGGPGGPPL